MKTVYFDCFSGASGDMILGALVHAGVSERELIEQLKRLGVENYEVRFETVDRAGISATRALVTTGEERHHRGLSDIVKIIEDSSLSVSVKERAIKIFTKLAQAEAKVHNEPIERVHFHEVGALDAIIDIVGACICFDILGVERFVSSALHVGSGTVEMAHGRFPVPAPAVTEILRDVPVYSTDVRGELVTPTGAAIISTVCESYVPLPKMRIEQTGYGAGGREYNNFPNALRVFVGETEINARNGNDGLLVRDDTLPPSATSTLVERLLMLETNIDDCSPQTLGYVMDKAFASGALDCFFTGAQMKKNRPGTVVSILCRPADAERLRAMLFAETTTLGVRTTEVLRHAVARKIVTVETEYGEINLKVARLEDATERATPEYEDCRRAAESYGVSLLCVEQAARAAFAKS